MFGREKRAGTLIFLLPPSSLHLSSPLTWDGQSVLDPEACLSSVFSHPRETSRGFLALESETRAWGRIVLAHISSP